MVKDNILFSIITIVNKEDVYQQFKRNLSEQRGLNYELIKINNDHNQFESAREAYNQALDKCHGEYLIFLHPDIRFLDNMALYDVLKQIIYISNLGVAGIAGCPSKLVHHKSVILTTIVQDNPPYHFGTNISKPTKVQTLDECFFVIKKAFLEKHHFSNIKGWHMYAVEQCLIALMNGKENYVVPARIWHMSPGSSENWQYVQTGRELVRRYGKYFPSINTTMTTWNTSSRLNLIFVPPLKYIKHKLWRKLHLNRR